MRSAINPCVIKKKSRVEILTYMFAFSLDYRALKKNIYIYILLITVNKILTARRMQ